MKYVQLWLYMQKAPQIHSTTLSFIIVTINIIRFTDVYNLMNCAQNLWKSVEFSADSMQIYSYLTDYWGDDLWCKHWGLWCFTEIYTAALVNPTQEGEINQSLMTYFHWLYTAHSSRQRTQKTLRISLICK